MTDMVNGKGPRDVFVNMIAKAISTGKKVQAHKSPRDNAFYAGRISAFVHSAAMLAELMYGCDFLEVRHRLMKELEDVHLSWSDGDLRDAGKVGNMATTIASRVLLEV